MSNRGRLLLKSERRQSAQMMDEVDDAWKQYDEEKAAEEAEPEQEPQRAASSLDDTYQELRRHRLLRQYSRQ
jgi:hypothetical protein